MKLGRKKTGGKYKRRRKKKLERTRQKTALKLGEEKKKKLRKLGGGKKVRLLRSKFMNIPSKGKTIKTEITNVLETPSNRFLARQNIITKGTIVETKLGKAKIINRPSQEGIINGVLIE